MNKSAIHYLKQALALAELRRGFCAPNPSVGAILVKDENILTTGYHWASGYPHAEAIALNKIDSQLAKNSTLYVTLQPCCHTTKKTPPCAELLIKKAIVKVVYAFRDPNPSVGDYCDKHLQQAGIICVQQSLPEIDQFYASYKFWCRHKRPFVTAKLAISLDGKIALSQNQRIQLTGQTAQQFTHQQRKFADAILTTAKTIRCDNPSLNVRIDDTIVSKPIYILDSKLITPLSAAIFSTAKNVTLFYKADLKIAKKQEQYKKNNVRLVPIKGDNNELNLLDILKHIGKDGYHDLWIEAGGRCFQSFVQNQLLQRAFIYVSPQWLGSNAQNAFTSPDVLTLAQQSSPSLLGADVCFKFDWP